MGPCFQSCWCFSVLTCHVWMTFLNYHPAVALICRQGTHRSPDLVHLSTLNPKNFCRNNYRRIRIPVSWEHLHNLLLKWDGMVIYLKKSAEHTGRIHGCNFGITNAAAETHLPKRPPRTPTTSTPPSKMAAPMIPKAPVSRWQMVGSVDGSDSTKSWWDFMGVLTDINQRLVVIQAAMVWRLWKHGRCSQDCYLMLFVCLEDMTYTNWDVISSRIRIWTDLNNGLPILLTCPQTTA
jgi:hypothetical protein